MLKRDARRETLTKVLFNVFFGSKVEQIFPIIF